VPRVCTVCQHRARGRIDEALLAGIAHCALSREFGLSRDALRRHGEAHISATLSHAHKAGEVARADNLLAQVQDLQGKALRILRKAERAGDLRAATGAIREARGCVELLGKLAGELQDGVTVNVAVLPEWQRLRGAILVAVEPFPEARAAIVKALEVGDAER
jgi:hypothetical protein